MGLSLKNIMESIHEGLPNTLTKESRVLKGKLHAYIDKNRYQIGFISDNTAKTKKYSKGLNYIFLNTVVNQREFISMFYNNDNGLITKTKVSTAMERVKKSKVYNEVNALPKQLEVSLNYESKITPYRIVYHSKDEVSILYDIRKRNFQGARYAESGIQLSGQVLDKLFARYITYYKPGFSSKVNFDSESSMFCMYMHSKDLGESVQLVMDYIDFVNKGNLDKIAKL